MRSGEQDIFPRDAGFFLNEFARCFRRIASDGEGVEADDGDLLFPVVEDCGADLWRIVDDGSDGFAVVAGIFHPRIWNDLTVGESGFDLGKCKGRQGDKREKDLHGIAG